MEGLQWNFENSYAKLSEQLFSKTLPEKVAKPDIVLWNSELAKELGLGSKGFLEDMPSDLVVNLTDVFSGNIIPKGAEPIAQAYSGHQFGHYNVLGDGRAVLLGEHIDPNGLRNDIQLKGSGVTKYSRRGDGRATLYSMLREYLISESMHGLGISTTRALSVVATGEQVWREKVQEGGVLCRVASSHIRVGTFEFVRRNQSTEALKLFTDYVIDRHYPELSKANNPYLSFLNRVIEEQVKTVTNWLRVGFIHGVMNTDNTSISGETIDYGPCAFMNVYNPLTVFSSIDRGGRYAFGNQDKILMWNIARFAECLLPLIDEDQDKSLDMAQKAIASFPELFMKSYMNMMAFKLGLIKLQEDSNEDVELTKTRIIGEVLDYFETQKLDYTNGFLKLGKYVEDTISGQTGMISKNERLKIEQHLPLWIKQLEDEVLESSLRLMNLYNPQFIPRNHMVEKALLLASEHEDYNLFNDLLSIMKTPYKKQLGMEQFQNPPEGGDDGYKTFCGT